MQSGQLDYSRIGYGTEATGAATLRQLRGRARLGLPNFRQFMLLVDGVGLRKLAVVDPEASVSCRAGLASLRRPQLAACDDTINQAVCHGLPRLQYVIAIDIPLNAIQRLTRGRG